MSQHQAAASGLGLGPGSSSSDYMAPAFLLASSLASAASPFVPPWAEPGERRRAAWLAAAGQGREGGDGHASHHPHPPPPRGWAYPSQRLLQHVLLKRHGGRVPLPAHPLKQVAASRFVQRKFCTVLIAKAVRGSHLGVAPARLAAALAEFDTAAAHHRVARISNTGSTYVASCGLFETWGSARRDALAAVAMASDLVAIAEALGLELCVGLTSGSVVGTLDPVSHAFYDLVGDVVSAATLMAELARAGQVFLGDSTYQLLAQRESSLPFRLPHVATHAVRAWLLSGSEETVRALSNPYAASWWHEHRQAEVLQAVRQWEEEQRGLPLREGGGGEEEEGDGIVRSMEEGVELQERRQRARRQGSQGQRQRQRQREQQQGREQQHRLFFSLADVYDLRGRLEGPRGAGDQGKWERYPTALATMAAGDDTEAGAAAAAGGPHATDSSISIGSDEARTGRSKGAWPACALDGGALLADLALPPRLELELLVAGVTLAVLVWSIRLPPWILAALLALVAAQAFLRWRPLPQQQQQQRRRRRRGPGSCGGKASTRDALLLLLYYLLCAAVILALPLDTEPYPLTLLRIMFLLVPALHLPTAPAVALAAEVYTVVLVSHVMHWVLHSPPTGSSTAREIRVGGMEGRHAGPRMPFTPLVFPPPPKQNTRNRTSSSASSGTAA